MARFFTRAIRPDPSAYDPSGITPNPNDPAAVPPSTVGPDQLVTPGDPHGVTIAGPDTTSGPPPRILPSAWSGWPAGWWPPYWQGFGGSSLTDVAWMCIDRNASILQAMPPYLTYDRPNRSSPVNADWINNPDPDLYTSWEEAAKQVFWDYQAVGEVFILATGRYATGWPARFHVVAPWYVQVEVRDGRRVYSIGNVDVTADMLHVRYQSVVGDAHGHGPLEAGGMRAQAADMLAQYGAGLATNGGVPSSILQHPEELSADQAATLQAQWVQARLSTLGEPAVLSGGVTWQATQMNAEEMALMDLVHYNERRICALLGVPPILVGVPTTGDPMTYSNVTTLADLHWRAGLRPMAQAVMAALSQWALPRGVRVELNRDAYVEPEPLQRAQTAQILHSIQDVDPVTGTVKTALTVDEIRGIERLDNSTPMSVSAPADVEAGF
jgi:HK97 family phage portal protein